MKLKTPNINSRDKEKKVLIVCEGERTEPDYFKKFRVSKQCAVVGAGCNTISVVQKAVDLFDGDKFKEAWCVFDRDSFKKDRVKGALELARNNNINIAFSNESFELWYVLHFAYLDTKVTRHDYKDFLTKKLGRKYKKNDSSIYQELLANQHLAIARAKKLKAEMLPEGACEHGCYPYTTVYELVERLNELGMSVGS